MGFKFLENQVKNRFCYIFLENQHERYSGKFPSFSKVSEKCKFVKIAYIATFRKEESVPNCLSESLKQVKSRGVIEDFALGDLLGKVGAKSSRV